MMVKVPIEVYKWVGTLSKKLPFRDRKNNLQTSKVQSDKKFLKINFFMRILKKLSTLFANLYYQQQAPTEDENQIEISEK